VPPKVEYSLTAYGRTLRPITDLMCAWGKKHLRRLEEKIDRWNRRGGDDDCLHLPAVSFGGGRGLLPAWVPGRQRRRRWVGVKLRIKAVRLWRNQGLTTTWARSS